ncbi:MAG TPA: type IV secretory system conjugative DNA transfer family protein [Acidimicrobiales bacterium]|nr:type IV secretory system conjugative DNA transfer family protein [Acidimicrobiales bacterium]
MNSSIIFPPAGGRPQRSAVGRAGAAAGRTERTHGSRTPTVDPLALLVAFSRARGHGIYLGHGSAGAVHAPPENGALVLGPPRAGKTSGVVVPNVLGADGSVVAVSTKRDVMEVTAAARRRLGRCLLYDPSGTLAAPPGVERVGWSPVASARDWNAAVLTAEAMVGAARPGGDRGEASHWSERAAALLAAMLHGAALADASVGDLVAAVNRREPERFLGVLARGGADLALDLLTGILATDGRELSGIWSTVSGVLGAYRTSEALASSEAPVLDARSLVAERTTLYVAAPGEHQRQAGALVAGIVRDVRNAAYAMDAERRGQAVGAERAGPGGGSAPVLLVLDELANIAPLHDLPSLVAEGASQGVLTLACLQDLTQARGRWGAAADGFLSLFGAKLVLPGLGDTRTLEAISVLAGEREVPALSRTVDRGRSLIPRRVSRTTSTRRERRLPPDAIAAAPAGTALLLLGARPARVEITPYFAYSPWREALAPTGVSGPHRELGGASDAPRQVPLPTGRSARRARPGRELDGRGRDRGGLGR